jgi:hypothetical protein
LCYYIVKFSVDAWMTFLTLRATVLFGMLSGILLTASMPLHLASAEETGPLLSVVSSSAPGSLGGSSGQARGDFNGDGFEDLAVGSSHETIAGIDAGAVNVLYGSADGITSTNDQLWHQNSPGIADSVETDDQFGRAVAAGDFNNDGYSDLAIGVPHENVDTVAGAGAVHVIYGTAAGLSSSGDQFWHQGRPGIEDNLEDGDFFGSSLTSGDFNGDGYHDLAVGAEAEDIGSIFDAGGVNVIYGSSSGLAATGDQFWSQNSRGILNEAERQDWFGRALAAGDFNGDGKDDLSIGVPRDSIGAVEGAGGVQVLYGTASGLSSSNDQFWHQGKPGIEDNEEEEDQFGYSLATGDFDGDGFDDLAVGVIYEKNGVIESGAVNVIYGTDSGLSSADDQLWSQDSPGVPETNEGGDNFGLSVAAGDFNGDGYYDLTIGIPFESLGAVNYAGAVIVLYGSANGITGTGSQLLHQDIAGAEGSPGDQDEFGYSLRIGDFNGDGTDDLGVGVLFDVVNTVEGAGAVQVFYSTDAGISTDEDQLWHQDSAGVEETAELFDAFGSSVA